MSETQHSAALKQINHKILADGESLPTVQLRDGSRVQTGTVATMLVNIKQFDAGIDQATIAKELELAIPTLFKVGLFDLFGPEEWIHGKSAGRRFIGEKAQEYLRQQQSEQEKLP